MVRMGDRRQLLLRNLAFGAMVGAGIGLVGVLSSSAPFDITAAAGSVIGGALGGAVIFALAAALWRMVVR
jgi:hypothetical protein